MIKASQPSPLPWVVLGAAFVVGLALGPEPVAGASQVQSGSAVSAQSGGRGTGQRAGGPSRNQNWWEDESFRKELGLTDAKAKRIANHYDSRERQMMPYLEALTKEHAVLDKLARERSVSVSAFAVQAAKTQALRTKLDESRDVMIYRISLELTTEQLQKLDQRIRSRRGPAPPSGSGSTTPPLEWFQDPAVKQELGLSEDKAKRLTGIHESRARRMQPYFEDLARENATLAAIARDKAPVSTYAVQVAKVRALRSRISESREVMSYQMSLELTPEQVLKLEQRNSSRGRRGGGPR